MNYNSRRVAGRDYTRPLKDLIPDMIRDSPMSVAQIAKQAGRCTQTVYKVINPLHKSGQIHIARWRRNRSSSPTAMFKFGSGKDAARPDPIPVAERVRKYQQSPHGRIVNQSIKLRQQKNRRAQRAFARHGIAGIDPLLAILTGQGKLPQTPIDQLDRTSG